MCAEGDDKTYQPAHRVWLFIWSRKLNRLQRDIKSCAAACVIPVAFKNIVEWGTRECVEHTRGFNVFWSIRECRSTCKTLQTFKRIVGWGTHSGFWGNLVTRHLFLDKDVERCGTKRTDKCKSHVRTLYYTCVQKDIIKVSACAYRLVRYLKTCKSNRL